MAKNPTLLRYLRVGTCAVLVQVYIQVQPIPIRFWLKMGLTLEFVSKLAKLIFYYLVLCIHTWC
jgi:hypothetical protein